MSLCFVYMFSVAESDTYNSYGVACTEVEIDILTGQTEVLRVDILFDCGDR